MEYQTSSAPARMHPLMVGAAASVTLVSLLGVAAITGLIPSSHGINVPAAAPLAAETAPAAPKTLGATPLALVAPARYMTPDGQVLEAVPNTQTLTPVATRATSATIAATQAYEPAPVIHHKPVHLAQAHQSASVVHHKTVHHHAQNYAQNTYAQPVREYQQPYYAQPVQHPIQSYVSDMHPVGTGVGAVVGGLLGNQVGGGNGKKLATVAGVLLGGYAGNEVAHNRNPLP
jgi:uncharacterized protein YcfJ